MTAANKIQSEAGQTGDDWDRLHPGAIVFLLVTAVKQLLSNALPAVAGAYAAVSALKDTFGQVIPVVIGLFVFLIIASAIASYLRFGYRIEATRILVRRGVFQREELSLDYQRIQNVGTEQPLYAKPFGLVRAKIDTAGSAGREISLDGVRQPVADRIRSLVADRGRGNASTDADAQSGTDVDTETIHRVGDWQLTRYAFANGTFVLLALVIGALFSQEDFWSKIDYESAAWWWIQLAGTLEPNAVTLWAMFGVVLVIVFVILISMLGVFLPNFRYHLESAENVFTATSGLLSRQVRSLNRGKIQALTVRQNGLSRWIGMMSIKVHQADSGGSDYDPNQSRSRKFIVPAILDQDCKKLLLVFQPTIATPIELLSPSRRLLKKLLAFGAVFAAFVILIIWAIDFSVVANVVLSAIAIGIGPGAAYLRWRRYGLAIVGGFGFFRKGLIGQQVTAFSMHRIQRFDISQSPFQRRSGLCSIQLFLAAKPLSFPHIPVELARQIRDLALFSAETGMDVGV